MLWLQNVDYYFRTQAPKTYYYNGKYMSLKYSLVKIEAHYTHTIVLVSLATFLNLKKSMYYVVYFILQFIS